jgi:hypothetical protein
VLENVGPERKPRTVGTVRFFRSEYSLHGVAPIDYPPAEACLGVQTREWLAKTIPVQKGVRPSIDRGAIFSEASTNALGLERLDLPSMT